MNPATRPLSLTASPPLPNPPGNDGPRGAIDHEPSGASIGPRGVVVVGDSGDSGLLDGGRLNDLPRLAVIQQRKALAAHEQNQQWISWKTSRRKSNGSSFRLLLLVSSGLASRPGDSDDRGRGHSNRLLATCGERTSRRFLRSIDRK